MKNSIILCSGGLDSVTTAHYVKKKLKYNKLIILFFDYNQRSLRKERECSKQCARDLKAVFKEIKLSELSKLSNSLINVNKKHKKLSRKDLKNTKSESQKYYVPFRNVIFISYAIAQVESLKNKYDIFLGFKNEGSESYPDTTIEFVKQMNKLSKFSNFKGKIFAPLIKKDKEDIVKLGKKLGVDFSKTYSCYTSNKKHCGSCLACKLRQEGFYWSGIKDPTIY